LVLDDETLNDFLGIDAFLLVEPVDSLEPKLEILNGFKLIRKALQSCQGGGAEITL